jgi:riboflavin kinase/FMN adenylyltransferase
MQKFNSLSELDLDLSNGSVVTIGMFDGVHVGHQQVIQACADYSLSNSLTSILITFSNHPADYFKPEQSTRLLTQENEKLELLAKSGIKNVIMLPFDQTMADLTAVDFVESILVNKLNCKAVVFGYDNHFGKNREGSKDFVDTNYSDSIHTIVVNEQLIESEIISSSRIKRHLENGEIELANTCLGYSYEISATVIHGNALGRTIGFPTANYSLLTANKVLPQVGVYLTKSQIKTPMDTIECFGLTNIGFRPTVTNTPTLSIETNLLDFDADIYGLPIRTQFIQRIRSEVKFNSLEELKSQISKDKLVALAILT